MGGGGSVSSKSKVQKKNDYRTRRNIAAVVDLSSIKVKHGIVVLAVQQ